MESIYMAFAFSVLRAALLVAGGWLVSRGVVDDSLMREVAAGLALIIVTQIWSFTRIYKRQLYQRWLVRLGLRETPATPVTDIEAAARARVKDGWVP